MNKPKKPAAAPAKQAKSGISVGLLVLVLAAAAALVAVLVARRGGGIVAQDSGIVFVDRLPSGAYPNVTGRVQILGQLVRGYRVFSLTGRRLWSDVAAAD